MPSKIENHFIKFMKKTELSKNSSGKYENPLSFLFPSPQLACSPGSCKLKTALISALFKKKFYFLF